MTPGPTCLGLEITDRCDLACAHCLRQVVPPHSSRARDLDPRLVARLCAEAREIGITSVGLTGGEPMLHPQFLEIVDTIVDAGLEYHFLSNGLGLPELLPRWSSRPERRARLRDVCVSVDGATARTHERIRGTGTFRRTLAGIAVLRAQGIPFSILHCINRVNRHEIDQMGLFAHHLGAKRLYFTHFLPNGRPYSTADLDLSTAERHDVEAVVKRLIHAMRFEIVMGEGYHTETIDHECATVLLKMVNVDPSGHLTFCCELSNYYGDSRAPESRDDWVADLAKTSLGAAIALQRARIERFRRERLEEAARGGFTEDDAFACRYCVRHFGKPEGPIVQLRTSRRPLAGAGA
jgi:MoaA/NifB/PqqE/SkfB family radical SAM enzyme